MEKIKAFLKQYEAKIILIIGLVLVAVISFEIGLLKGKMVKNNPIVVEIPSQNPKIVQESPNQPQQEGRTDALVKPEALTANLSSQNHKCAYVGSKNSNKYHLPTCRWAKQIKPENLVCFSSVEEATQKGYQPDKNCIK